MKKHGLLIVALAVAMVLSLTACGGGDSADSTVTVSEAFNASDVPETVAEPAEVEETPETVDEPSPAPEEIPEEETEDSTEGGDMDIYSLSPGDEVHIIGQKANATLVNDKEIWVQVVRQNERTIIYHCQLKDEYIEQGGSYKLADVVKVKGNFLSIMDLAGEEGVPVEEENLGIMVTLYDCEIE